MILGFDCETSDFVVKEELPSNHKQPHIMQLAAVLADDDGKEQASFSFIVKPEGWQATAGAINAHGITMERAALVGVPLLVPLACFSNLAKHATRFVGHNVEYDIKALAAEFYRVKRPMPSVDACCTMRRSEGAVNLPPTEKMRAKGMTKPKAPTLQELHRWCFGVEFDGAHDAMNDVRATLRCFFELKKRGAIA